MEPALVEVRRATGSTGIGLRIGLAARHRRPAAGRGLLRAGGRFQIRSLKLPGAAPQVSANRVGEHEGLAEAGVGAGDQRTGTLSMRMSMSCPIGGRENAGSLTQRAVVIPCPEPSLITAPTTDEAAGLHAD